MDRPPTRKFAGAFLSFFTCAYVPVRFPNIPGDPASKRRDWSAFTTQNANHRIASRRHKLIGKLRGVASPVRTTPTAQRTVKNFLLGGMAALALLAATSGEARAQFVEPAARKPFAVRLGTYIPSEPEGRAAGGDYMWALEVDYTIQRMPERTSVSIISTGFIERGDLRIIPLTVGQVWRQQGNPLYFGESYFYGFGGGVYNVRLSAPDTSGNDKFIPGGYIHAGIDFNSKYFFETKYHYIAKYDRKFIGGLMFSVGARF